MNLSDGGPPTLRVGESSVASSGCFSSSVLQLVEEPVVLRVRDLGVVEDVVAVVVVVQELPELRRARGSQRAARSSSAVSTTVSGSSASSRSRGWMRPQVTATECIPAALAARMSNGESPT